MSGMACTTRNRQLMRVATQNALLKWDELRIQNKTRDGRMLTLA